MVTWSTYCAEQHLICQGNTLLCSALAEVQALLGTKFTAEKTSLSVPLLLMLFHWGTYHFREDCWYPIGLLFMPKRKSPTEEMETTLGTDYAIAWLLGHSLGSSSLLRQRKLGSPATWLRALKTGLSKAFSNSILKLSFHLFFFPNVCKWNVYFHTE